MDLEQQIEAFNRLCPCCGVDSENEPLSICCDNMELADLGEGYVLFFKLMIYFGVIALFFYGINIYKLVVNIQGDLCTNRPPELGGSDLKTFGKDKIPPCFNDFINPHSIANYGLDKIDVVERSLMVAFLGFFWLAMALVYHKVLQISRHIDEQNDTPSDWTLMVVSTHQFKHLPVDEDEKTTMNNLQQDPIFTKNSELQIKKVVLAYNLEEYLKIFNEVSKKKIQVKKMQFKENKEKMTLTVLQELGGQKDHFSSMSVENLERSSSKFGKPSKQPSIEQSFTIRRRLRVEPSSELKEELEKLKQLNIQVSFLHLVRNS